MKDVGLDIHAVTRIADCGEFGLIEVFAIGKCADAIAQADLRIGLCFQLAEEIG